MEISNNYKRVLYNIYNSEDTLQEIYPERDSIEDNIFGKFLSVKCSENLINIPLFCRYSIEKCIMNNYFQDQNFENIAINLNVEKVENVDYLEECKSPYNIIKKFFFSSKINTLERAKSTQGEIYYGGKGIILDSDFKPLFLAFATMDIANSFSYNKVSIYIDKKVFISKDSISKTIIKKLIPFYSYNHTYINTFHHSFCNKLYNEIVIIDLSNSIKIVATPKYSVNLQDELTEVLTKNINEVLQFDILKI